jgi:hypothetical protein
MSIAYPASPYDEIYTEYPKNKYLIGIGEVNKTNNTIQDKRIAEVLARLEIAKQIKVRLREETLDIMCEGSFERLFKDALKCRNEFIMIIEVTVDEFLRGSKIVTHGERDGIVYAVAVMPRTQAVVELDKNIQKSINKTREEIEKAKQGDSESIEEAEKEFMKAVTYNKERELIEGVKGHASEIFEELEKELVKLKRGQGK